MNLASSAAGLILLSFKRSMTASTDGWNLDCSATRFCSAGERVLRASASLKPSTLTLLMAFGGGAPLTVLGDAGLVPPPCPPGPPPPARGGVDLANSAPLVTV